MTVVKIKWKNSRKRGLYGVGNKIKMISNVGSVNKIKSNHENLWWGEKT